MHLLIKKEKGGCLTYRTKPWLWQYIFKTLGCSRSHFKKISLLYTWTFFICVIMRKYFFVSSGNKYIFNALDLKWKATMQKLASEALCLVPQSCRSWWLQGPWRVSVDGLLNCLLHARTVLVMQLWNGVSHSGYRNVILRFYQCF